VAENVFLDALFTKEISLGTVFTFLVSLYAYVPWDADRRIEEGGEYRSRCCGLSSLAKVLRSEDGCECECDGS
jgi:hypothetical protein